MAKGLTSNCNILVFGAGQIGRGLLGEWAVKARRQVTFVEANQGMAKRLIAAGRYHVRLEGRFSSATDVADYTVLALDNQAAITESVVECEFAATAVGGEHLPELAGLLEEGLMQRTTPLNILLCENWPKADEVLDEALTARGIRADLYSCATCSVERMVRSDGETLDLVGESGESVFVDISKWKGGQPEMDGLNLVEDIVPYHARKLFTNNTGHAVLAYRGFLAGYQYLFEAMIDPAILATLKELLSVSSEMLTIEYGMDRQQLREHINSLLTYRFSNKGLADSVRRVARQPLRKLAPEERLVGLLRRLQKHGLPCFAICDTIASALLYDDIKDAECIRMKEMIQKGGPEQVLRDICGILPNENCFREIMKAYTKLGGVVMFR